MTYSNYSEKVKSYMEKLEKTLIKEQGEISLATEFNLSLLADNLQIYFDIVEDIKTNGVVRIGKEKQLVKNPLLPALNSQNMIIAKLISSLGLTPMSKSKLKTIQDDNEDELDELID